MGKFKAIYGLILVVGLVVAGLVALSPTRATAQSVSGLPATGATSGTGTSNPYDGRGEMVQTWTGTLSTSALGVICTAVSGQRVSVKSCEITCATAQTIDLYDGSTIQGSSVLAHVYCIAATPHQLGRDILGTGITTTVGNGLSVLGGSTGVMTIIYSVQRPTQ